jgi:hypothetical protein
MRADLRPQHEPWITHSRCVIEAPKGGFDATCESLVFGMNDPVSAVVSAVKLPNWL